jgi:tetratricopeptide (TPR) repeat protein
VPRRPHPLALVVPLLLAALVRAAAAQDPAAGAPAPAAADPAEVEARRHAAVAAAVNGLVAEGNKARKEGRLQAAIDAYRSASSLDPQRYEIRILLADTLRRHGRAAEAAAAYKEAATLAPDRAEGYTGQAILKRAEYDFDGASAILLAALAQVQAVDRADLLVTLGETRRRKGKPDEAAARFKEALAADPKNATAQAGLARLAEERGDLDGAVALWGRFLDLEPEDAPARQRRAELAEVRDALAALQAAAKGAGSGKAGAEVWGEIGRLRAIAGDAPGAAEAYRAALKRAPKDAAVRRGLALALESAGDAAGAGAEFAKLLEVSPGDPIALYHLAGLARRRADPAAEERAWRDLAAAHPDDLYAARALAAFVERTGEAARGRVLAAIVPGMSGLRLRALLLADADAWPEVESALEAALRVDATDPWTLDVFTDLLGRRPEMLMHLAARAQKDLAGAQAGDRHAPPADPTPSLLVLARCHLIAGHRSEARAILDRVVAARPQLAVPRSALAETQQGPGRDRSAAIASLEQAIAIDPARLAPHVDLALLFLRLRRAADAERAARRGLETHPEAAPLLSLLGAARADQDDAEGAARFYARALVADPADNFHLARGQYPAVLASLGRTFEARRALGGTLPALGDLQYLEAWAFARDSFRDRTYRDQDWNAFRSRHRDLAAAGAGHAADRAIAQMLAALGDPYTRLRDPEETAAVWLTRHQAPAGSDALGRNRPAGATVTTGDLPGNLGYVQIANFTDPNAVRELRRALEALGGKSGIVLDLRGNAGGLTRSADEAADLLLGPGVEVGSESGPDGTVERVTRGDGALTGAPLTVLVDGQTASAAERLADSLESSGRAAIVGGSTFGKGLLQTSRVLPGGGTVLVSTGETFDRQGEPIQGRGVRAPVQEARPDEPAPPPQP